MSDGNRFAGDFSGFGGRAWMNCAHQGPLPALAAQAVRDALERKQFPSLISDDDFVTVPRDLKAAIGKLLGVPAAEIIVGNSATYGLHLLAQGLPLRPGDEVVCVDGDFPATVVPWTAVRSRGARLRVIRPAGPYLTAADIARQLGPATRVVCTSWVFSFTGYTVDLTEIGSACRDRGVVFVVNASQGLGARPLDLSALPVDALVSCGHKWLCGPYGTGLCWVRPDLLERLEYEQPYWQHGQTASDLGDGLRYELPAGLGAARYDVFGTANFLNYSGWTQSVRYLLGKDLAEVAAHNSMLVDRLIAGLDRRTYRLLSPPAGPSRSSLVLMTHRDPGRNRQAHAILRSAGVDAALRGNRLRFSPHLYNTPSDIDRALDALAG